MASWSSLSTYHKMKDSVVREVYRFDYYESMGTNGMYRDNGDISSDSFGKVICIQRDLIKGTEEKNRCLTGGRNEDAFFCDGNEVPVDGSCGSHKRSSSDDSSVVSVPTRKGLKRHRRDIKAASFLSDERKNDEVICIDSPNIGTQLRVQSEESVNNKGGKGVVLSRSCRKASTESPIFLDGDSDNEDDEVICLGSETYQRKQEGCANEAVIMDLAVSKSRKRLFGSPSAIDKDSDDDLNVTVWKSRTRVSESPFDVYKDSDHDLELKTKYCRRLSESPVDVDRDSDSDDLKSAPNQGKKIESIKDESERGIIMPTFSTLSALDGDSKESETIATEIKNEIIDVWKNCPPSNNIIRSFKSSRIDHSMSRKISMESREKSITLDGKDIPIEKSTPKNRSYTDGVSSGESRASSVCSGDSSASEMLEDEASDVKSSTGSTLFRDSSESISDDNKLLDNHSEASFDSDEYSSDEYSSDGYSSTGFVSDQTFKLSRQNRLQVKNGITCESTPMPTVAANDEELPLTIIIGKRQRTRTKRLLDEVSIRLPTKKENESEIDDSDAEVEEGSDWGSDDSEEDLQDVWGEEALSYSRSSDEDETTNVSEDNSDEKKKVFGSKNGRRNRSRTRRKRRLDRKNIKKIPKLSIEGKENFLRSISSLDANKELGHKFTQCLLWDLDFRYNLLPHQYDGTLAVAGLNVSIMHKLLVNAYHEKRGILLQQSKNGELLRRNICSSIKFVDTKGVLLADDMGLGKTIQGLAGAILRQGIQSMRSKRQKIMPEGGGQDETMIAKDLPIAIVGPNLDVLAQWEETLLKSGMKSKKIEYFHPCNEASESSGYKFILLTRHQLMTETRSFLERKEQSKLYPKFDMTFIDMLKNQYLANKGKARNKWKRLDVNNQVMETDNECITRLFVQNTKLIGEPIFRTILIDEAHFLKNLLSFWAIGAALLGMVSERTVPLSGTPYNNGPQDMATLMTFIDPSKDSSKVRWWENATKGLSGRNNANKVAQWRDKYLVRRDKSVLTIRLPPKVIKKHRVQSLPTELGVYNYFEDSFLKALNEISGLEVRMPTPEERQRMNTMFKVLMAATSSMRMCLIHPLVPDGREYTVRFSPSRRKCQRIISILSKESSQVCVCCQRNFSEKAAQLQDKRRNNQDDNVNVLTKEELENFANMGGAIVDDEEMQNADFDRVARTTHHSEDDLGELVQLPSKYCRACEGIPHYIHTQCLEHREKSNDQWSCPRCDDLNNRIMVNRQTPSDRPIYCEHIVCGGEKGIQANAKIHEVVQWVSLLPTNEKAIVYSFFKAGLDLLEGIFVEQLGIECARFDGDISPEDRSKELDHFKSSGSCRILLASVQSSGVGLNIVEANHVAFLDRWFNPCVHAQAEDRCHRLGQKKTVTVTYFDTDMTIDKVMLHINEMKSNNAKVLLADGSDIGVGQSGMTYRDMTGKVGGILREISSSRRKFEEYYDNTSCLEPTKRQVLLERFQLNLDIKLNYKIEVDASNEDITT